MNKFIILKIILEFRNFELDKENYKHKLGRMKHKRMLGSQNKHIVCNIDMTDDINSILKYIFLILSNCWSHIMIISLLHIVTRVNKRYRAGSTVK